MDRLIEVKVNGHHLTKDNTVAGVQHEANATVLRIEFDHGWDDLTKTVTFWDALGRNPVKRVLTVGMVEGQDARVYLCPIPGEAMAEAGRLEFVVDGWKDGVRSRSLSAQLAVKPAPKAEDAEQPVNPTPSQAEQIQAQVDKIKNDLLTIPANVARAETAATTAEGAAEEAVEARNEAQASETAAETSATEAKDSATKAAASEAAAKASEVNAAASEAKADQAIAASQEAVQAAGEANAARDAAQVSAANAARDAATASQAATQAAGDADDAETAAQAAQAAQAAAEKARDEAQETVGGDWATNKALEQVRTEVGEVKEDVQAHGTNKSNPHEVTKAQVGLGNVDNTADLDKPVSTAQQAAIDAASSNFLANLNAHIANKNNPHKVTAAQIGAITEGQVGNLHVWKRTQVLSEAVPAVPAGYTLGTVEENVALFKGVDNYCRFWHNSTVTVSENGECSIRAESNYDAFKLKVGTGGSAWVSCIEKYAADGTPWFMEPYDTGAIITDIVCIPTDAVATCKIETDTDGVSKTFCYISKLQRVTGYAATPEIPAGTHIDYLTSTDPEAYKESSNGEDAYYTLGDVVTGSLPLYATTDGKNYVNWEVAETAAVSDDGTVSLVSPTTVNISKTDYFSKANSMLGEYIRLKDDAYSKNTTVTPGSVFFIPSDATVTNGSLDGYQMVWLTKYQPVTGHAAVPANTTIEYLGQLGGAGLNAEITTYVGTGNFTVSINVNKRAKLFVIVPEGSGATGSGSFCLIFPKNNDCSEFRGCCYYMASYTGNFSATKTNGTLTWTGRNNNNYSDELFCCSEGTTYLVCCFY